jgi:hypothetical protein
MSMHGRSAVAGDGADSPYAHIRAPAEDGDDTVPPALPLQPTIESERADVVEPDADAPANPGDDLPEILPDTHASTD